MIVPMKKVSLVILERDRVGSLEKLREAGVVHLEKKKVSSDALVKLFDRKARLTKALGILRHYPVAAATPFKKHFHIDPDLTAQVLDLVEVKKNLREQLAHLSFERRRVEKWGDFDPSVFDFFASNGLPLFPYELSVKDYKTKAKDVQFLVFSRSQGTLKALAVGKEIPGVNPFKLPSLSLSKLDEQLADMRGRLAEIENEFAAMAFHRGILEEEEKHLLEEIEFETAKAGMESLEGIPADSSVSWISGFVPAESMDVLKKVATENVWALLAKDPVPGGDKPPTLLINKPSVQMIQPLFSFLGTVPGYWEYDISPSYLFFFSIFFAMIFGDAGYGMILIILALALGFSSKKASGKFSDISRLLLHLSVCTVIWGSINGAWFAIPKGNLPFFLQSLIIQPFNNTGPLEQFPLFLHNLFGMPEKIPSDGLKTRWNIQFLSFTVAVIQLVWARGKRIKRLLPSLQAFAQLGWLITMLGLYFLVLFILLRLPLPPFTAVLIGIGAFLNLVFAEQTGGNFLKNVAKGFGGLFQVFLKMVSCFADIISYIRLFAVGMAGAMIGQIVNAMAVPTEGLGSFGLNFVLKLIIAVLICVLGHGLNLMLTVLSVIVHGVRLNLLEYAGNQLEMEWSGYVYNPFALRQENKQG